MIIFINFFSLRGMSFTSLYCALRCSIVTSRNIFNIFAARMALNSEKKTTKRKEEKRGTGSDLMLYPAWLRRGSCSSNSSSVPRSSRSFEGGRGERRAFFSASVSVAASVPRADFPTDSFLIAWPRSRGSLRLPCVSPLAPVFFLRNLLSHLR